MKKRQTFNDGIIDIYRIGSGERLFKIIGGIRFENRTVGSERFFKARDFQHTASKLIRIPKIQEPSANSVVVMGDKQYNILQVQSISDTAPECWQLTLEEIKQRQMMSSEQHKH